MKRNQIRRTDVTKRLLLAAEQGDADAQFNLGVLYDNRLDDNHRPIAGNRGQAMEWFLRAASQGLPRAQVRLAEMHADGPETSEDSVRACAWFLLAIENLSGIHRQRAQSGYAQISSHMTAPQITEARDRARVSKPNRQIDIAATRSQQISRQAVAAKVFRTAGGFPPLMPVRKRIAPDPLCR